MDILEQYINSIAYKFPKGYPDMNDSNDVMLLESLISSTLGHPFKINEVALSPTQIEKPFHSELKDKYDDRGELFLFKIKNGDPFILNNGSEIIVDPKNSEEAIALLQAKNYGALGGSKKLFQDVTGDKYSLSDFKKTEEFGSGKGSGGGASNTQIQESSQCIVNSIAYSIKKSQITEEDLTDVNIENAFKYSNVDGSKEEIAEFIQSSNWKGSLVSTANILYSNYQNSNFQHHRNSEFVNSIFIAFENAKKSENISMQDDKWNPADIWMVDKSILGMSFPSDLNELNSTLLQLFEANKLIGVSLKKTGKEAHISVQNGNDTKTNSIVYKGYASLPTNKQISILFEGGKITFRTFNFATNYAGEIDGKTAQHGKIGQGALNSVLSKNDETTLPKPLDIKQAIQNNNTDVIDEFYSNYNDIVEKIGKEEFIQLLSTKELDWKVSKFLSAKLGVIFEEMSSDMRNKVLSDMIGYASSSTSISSVFVKVS